MVYILQYKKDLFPSINITLLHITLKTQGFVWGFHGNKAKIYSLVWPPVDTIRILQPPLNSIFLIFSITCQDLMSVRAKTAILLLPQSMKPVIYLLNQQSHRFAKGLLENNNFFT